MTSEGGGADGISALSYQAGGNPRIRCARRSRESAALGGQSPNAMRTGGLDESAVPGGESPDTMRTAFEGKRRPRGSVL